MAQRPFTVSAARWAARVIVCLIDGPSHIDAVKDDRTVAMLLTATNLIALGDPS